LHGGILNAKAVRRKAEPNDRGCVGWGTGDALE
jgi:hypothetical protein